CPRQRSLRRVSSWRWSFSATVARTAYAPADVPAGIVSSSGQVPSVPRVVFAASTLPASVALGKRRLANANRLLSYTPHSSLGWFERSPTLPAQATRHRGRV